MNENQSDAGRRHFEAGRLTAHALNLMGQGNFNAAMEMLDSIIEVAEYAYHAYQLRAVCRLMQRMDLHLENKQEDVQKSISDLRKTIDILSLFID